jgi:hypothetical protein
VNAVHSCFHISGLVTSIVGSVHKERSLSPSRVSGQFSLWVRNQQDSPKNQESSMKAQLESLS